MRPNLGAVLLLVFAVSLRAQARAIGWGEYGFDSLSALDIPVAVDAGSRVTTILTASGRVHSRGANANGQCYVPQLAPGRRYVSVSTGWLSGAVVDDGTLRIWGGSFWPWPVVPLGSAVAKVNASRDFLTVLTVNGEVVASGNIVPPVPPAGLVYTDISSGQGHGYALRSDGVWVPWGVNNYGQISGPAPVAGATVVKIVCGFVTSAAVFSDGTIQVWGYQGDGQANVPPAPSGLTYIDVSVGNFHCVGLLSDGSLVAWGSNTWGQCNIPTLPTGMSYTSFGAGEVHTVALRSDGEVMTFGGSAFEGKPIVVPAGQVLKVVHTGDFHAVAVTSGGQLIGAGADAHGQIAIPALPQGVTWTDCAAGREFSVGLASDGIVRAFGRNSAGQCNVPSLPPGLTYTQIACGETTAVALRSDGVAVAWGANVAAPLLFPLQLPTLPQGMSYRAVGMGGYFALLLRSDGAIVTSVGSGFSAAPVPPPGVEYVKAQGGFNFARALRSDGQIVQWDTSGSSMWPAPPNGTCYVDLATTRLHAFARRSDGEITASPNVPSYFQPPRPLPGTSYHSVDGGWGFTVVATVGSRTSYVAYADGCDPTGQAARLIPSDTPKLGQSFTIRIDRMTANLGWLGFGWSRLQPSVSLQAIGMPNCFLHVLPDVLVPVAGVGGWGGVTVPVPNLPALLGATWCNQALLLDSAAGPLSLKLSAAAEAIVGG
jgi:alpha-tubulin suppressor-like RCC1 family protein